MRKERTKQRFIPQHHGRNSPLSRRGNDTIHHGLGAVITTHRIYGDRERAQCVGFVGQLGAELKATVERDCEALRLRTSTVGYDDEIPRFTSRVKHSVSAFLALLTRRAYPIWQSTVTHNVSNANGEHATPLPREKRAQGAFQRATEQSPLLRELSTRIPPGAAQNL